MSSTAATAQLPKMRAALRHLCAHGEDAMKQRKMGDRWRKALVSKRVAAGLRKQAILDGTYGSFNTDTGIGWDPLWDKSGRMPNLRTPKEDVRVLERREQRAVKIESKMADMDKQIEDHRTMLKERKPEPTFENYYKRLMKGSRK